MDADIFCYKTAEAARKEIPFNEYFISITDSAEAKVALDNWIESVRKTIDADDVVLAFTGPNNYRKKIWDGYKAHRSKQPLETFNTLKTYCFKHYDCIMEESLEADDILGIHVSNNFIFNHEPVEVVGVSEDKDMKAIPGKIFNPAKDSFIQDISFEDAVYNFYLQVLVGDSADGYKGCIGVGETKARRSLDKLYQECREQVGFNYDAFIEHGWSLVKSFYTKAKQGDEVINATMAKILWYGEEGKVFKLDNLYNFKKRWKYAGKLNKDNLYFS